MHFLDTVARRAYFCVMPDMNEFNLARFDAKLEQRVAELEARIDLRAAELELRMVRRATTFGFWILQVATFLIVLAMVQLLR